MSRIGLWQVTDGIPHHLNESIIDLEKQLGDWIEKDPSLLRGDLTIVGRQIRTESGPLDLLALDPLGRWVVIELKAGSVRRETIGQAIDYAACIARMPFQELKEKVDRYLGHHGLSLETLPHVHVNELEDPGNEREVLMIVVGKGREAGLERIADFLSSGYDVPISVVNYDVFQLATGERILMRELTDSDFAPAQIERPRRAARDIEGLSRQADQNGNGELFRAMRLASEKHGFYARTYPGSVMYTPPQNRSRMLFTVWLKGKTKDQVKVYIGSSVFAEFYPIKAEAAAAELGPDGWRDMNKIDVQKFVDGLDRLFTELPS